jgi:hypothetical protein
MLLLQFSLGQKTFHCSPCLNKVTSISQIYKRYNKCSGMFIPNPGFYPSQIPDPGSQIPDPTTATKEEGENICCPTFFCSHKYHKIVNYFIFELKKKKIEQNLQRELLPKKLKIVTKL